MADEAKILIKIDDTEIRKIEDVEAQVKGLPTRGEPAVGRGSRGTKRPAPGSTAQKGFFQRNLARADGTIRGQLGNVAQNLGAQANPFTGTLRGAGAALTLTTAALSGVGKKDPTGLVNLMNKGLSKLEQELNGRIEKLDAEFAGRMQAFQQVQKMAQAMALLDTDPDKSGIDLTLMAKIMRMQAVGEAQSDSQIKRTLFKKTVGKTDFAKLLQPAKEAVFGDMKKSFLAVARNQ